MKKNLLLIGFAVVFAIATALNVNKSLDNLRPVQLQQKQAVQVKDSKVTMNDLGLGFENEINNVKGVKKISRKADEETYEITDTFYRRPAGTYHWGTDLTGNGYYGLVVPGEVETTWEALCEGEVEGKTTYQWFEQFGYYDDGGDYTTSWFLNGDEKTYEQPGHSDLINAVSYNGGIYLLGSSDFPYLTVDGNDEFFESSNDLPAGYGQRGIAQYGGKATIYDYLTGEITDQYPASATDPFGVDDAINSGYFYYSSEASGYGEYNPNANWLTNLQRVYGESATAARLVGLCEFLDKPLRPVVLNSIDWRVGYYSSDFTTLQLELYAVEDGKVANEPYATSSAFLPAKSMSDKTASFSGYVTFTFNSIDDLGLEVPGIVFEKETMAKLTGFADAAEAGKYDIFTSPVMLYEETNADKHNRFDAYAMVDMTYNDAHYDVLRSGAFGYYIDDAKTKVGYITSFDVNLDIDNIYLAAYPDEEDLDENGRVEFDEAGETKTIDILASNASGEWDILDNEGNDLPSWITIGEVKDYMFRDVTYDGYTTIELTADALPAGVEGRSCNVVLSYRGAKAVITVKQGAVSGVTDVKADDKANVSVAGGNFVINANAGETQAQIFNIAGQLVKTAELNQGTTVVDGQNLTNGAYIVRLNSGKSAKVAK